MNLRKSVLKELQKQVNQLIYDFSDCSFCGLCCKDEVLSLSIPDINRISRKIGMDKETFIAQYTTTDNNTKGTVMNMPCPFLKDNRCEIYEFRPEICKNYPLIIYENGIVEIREIECCAKATHFYELFLEFVKNNHVGYYNYLMGSYISCDVPNELSITSVKIPVEYLVLFKDWIVKNNKEHRA